jgi:hypothetical protein
MRKPQAVAVPRFATLATRALDDRRWLRRRQPVDLLSRNAGRMRCSLLSAQLMSLAPSGDRRAPRHLRDWPRYRPSSVPSDRSEGPASPRKEEPVLAELELTPTAALDDNRACGRDLPVRRRSVAQVVRTSSRGYHDRVRDRATVPGHSRAVSVYYRFACESGRLVAANLATARARPFQHSG